jgi:hypothetical protein
MHEEAGGLPMFSLFLLGLIAAASARSAPATGPYQDSWCSMTPAPHADYREVEGTKVKPVALKGRGRASEMLATKSAVLLSPRAAARFAPGWGGEDRVYLVRGAVYALNSDDIRNRLEYMRIETVWAPTTKMLVVSLYQ